MKKIVFTFLLMLCVGSTYSQWIANYGGNSNSDINFSNAKGNAVTMDANGYSYVTGYSYENLNLNDIVTIKYTPTGDTVWARNFNGTANLNDEGKGICVDASGNVYVVGFAEYVGKSTDVVIIKYNSAGTKIWDRQYSGSDLAYSDEGFGITVDASGFIYITGYSKGTDGYKDIFTRKYDANGNLVWGVTEDGTSNLNAEGCAITVGSTGNVFVTGYVTVSGSNTDIVTLKYNSAGTLQFSPTVNGGGNEQDKAWGIAVDNSDNVYITGFVTAANLYMDAYTAKYNSAGTMQWEKTYNGGGNVSDKAWGIVVDTDGSVYITGMTTDATLNVNYLTVKYNSTGLMLWGSSYNGTGNGYDEAASIAFVQTNVVVTGKSWGTTANYDYATVRYNKTTGAQTQLNRYSFTGLSNDLAKDVAVNLSSVVVTGYSQLIIESNVEESYISTVSYGDEMISEPVVPSKYSLSQNYPNPFNPGTTIKFDITEASSVKLAIYDMLGKEVDVLVNQQLNAGTHTISFNASKLASGVYFYKLEAGSFSDIKKMTLVK